MPAPRILILGATGGLGRALQSHFSPRFQTSTLGRAELDFEKPDTVSAALAGRDFDVLLNAAGMTSPDVCEVEPQRAFLANAVTPQVLAECCQKRGARMVHFSTDYVFSGEPHDVLTEQDETLPVNVYGRTKLAGEQAVLQASPRALVARVSWLFGHFKASHPDNIIQKALQTDDLAAVVDKVSAPTSNADICRWVEQLIISHPDVSGPLHLCNSGIASWHSWAEAALEIAHRLGLPVKTTRVQPIPLASLTQLKAPRPLMTLMSNQKLGGLLGAEIRSWYDALEEYLVEKYQPK
ncbi:dTDP-4-dehydrorhamnose reductase [Prosthecobacter vanneervenii]|uniref:dTDP-4-dehydrorhamnose reductase n=1 Tax=Prosthecobacter vanneervenii TaxID=48466 RepID=A0A7W7YBP0_9BACT|nr:dTDP-4-dehydrorhamnose reductase [Prosthecobacter vanneervenii]MBB5033042.1 dTDP-4-dehydrorhamnose reductase [Prosthecobacter vanneervenii]